MALPVQVDINLPGLTSGWYELKFGVVPRVVWGQAALPRLIETDWALTEALDREGALSAIQKELIQLVVAAARESRYELGLRCEMLRRHGFEDNHLAQVIFDWRQADLPAPDAALLDFALKLGGHPTAIGPDDIEELHRHGLTDQHVIEAVFAISWSNYRCMMASAVGVASDFRAPPIPSATIRRTKFQFPRTVRATAATRRPYVASPEVRPEAFPPFAQMQELYGMVPNVFRAQTLRPQLIQAQVKAVALVLHATKALSQLRKEYIFLAVSAANLNSYCVAIHCQTLKAMGLSEEVTQQVAVDHHHSNLSPADKALLDMCLKLAKHPEKFGDGDIAALGDHGFSETETLEATAVVALAVFFNTLDTGLGVQPDFDQPAWFDAAAAQASMHDLTVVLNEEGRNPLPREDPDATYVRRVQDGESEAFEELVRRHGRRVYRTTATVLGRTEEIEEVVQDTFMKAFRQIGTFEGRSRFSTWLTRIAVNASLQRLRRNREVVSLDEHPAALDSVRPRRLRPWQDDPEQAYSRTETRELIMAALMQMPLKYRSAVMLRDLQQLSTADAAEALGVGISAFKARLFRGRLMLREALSPHFEVKDRQV